MADPTPTRARRPACGRLLAVMVILVAASPAAAQPACATNPQEQQFAALMQQHPAQQRVALTCNAILARVARARAADMATRQYFAHTNPDGVGPNALVRQAGYSLPTWYGTGNADNYIESITAGRATAQDAFTSLLADDAHRNHLLGETPMYAPQTEYGIGYIAGGPYGHYWAVLTAQQER